MAVLGGQSIGVGRGRYRIESLVHRGLLRHIGNFAKTLVWSPGHNFLTPSVDWRITSRELLREVNLSDK